jgi:hypothetical protein
MSTRKKQARDEAGRFLPQEITLDDNRQAKMWKKFKTGLIVIILIVLGIPWSVLFFEPLRIYSDNMLDFARNKTYEVKNNLCNCRCLAQGVASTLTSF